MKTNCYKPLIRAQQVDLACWMSKQRWGLWAAFPAGRRDWQTWIIFFTKIPFISSKDFLSRGELLPEPQALNKRYGLIPDSPSLGCTLPGNAHMGPFPLYCIYKFSCICEARRWYVKALWGSSQDACGTQNGGKCECPPHPVQVTNTGTWSPPSLHESVGLGMGGWHGAKSSWAVCRMQP